MNCPTCHKPVAANAKFCGSCGQRIDSAPPPPPAATLLEPAMAGGASAAYGAAPAAGRTPSLFARARGLLLSPRTEWPVIAPESTTIAQLYTGYGVPLAALAAVLGFVRISVIGIRLPFAGLMRSPVAVGLTSAAMTFVMGLVGLYLVGLIINALAPTFGGARDTRQAMKVATYAFTPAWFGTLLALSPVLPTLLQFAAGCYGIYVLYLGLPVLMRAPRERAVGYTASVVVCCIVLGVVLGLVAGVVGGFGAHAGLGTALSGETREQRQARSAQDVGNVIGGMLGTDDKGKAGLGAAIDNLAKSGEAQQQRDKAAAAGSAPPAAAEPAAQNPLAAAGGLLAALGGAAGGPNRVEPVDFKTLTTLLPASVAGLARSNVKGEGQQAIGVKTTHAEADYTGQDASAHVEIADVSGVSGLMDLANGLVQTETSEGDNGYEKDVVIAGRKAHEKYDAQSRKAEINMIVARRFSVDVTGEHVPMATLERAYEGIDLAALEAMKDQGAQH